MLCVSVLTGCIQVLPTLPAAVMILMPRPSIFCRVERLAEDQLRKENKTRVKCDMKEEIINFMIDKHHHFYCFRSPEKMLSHLITARASWPDHLTVVSSAEQLLIGPEVDQVCQSVAALWAYEAGGMPQGAMVTCTFSINSRGLLSNLALTTSTPLKNRERETTEYQCERRPCIKLLVQTTVWHYEGTFIYCECHLCKQIWICRQGTKILAKMQSWNYLISY